MTTTKTTKATGDGIVLAQVRLRGLAPLLMHNGRLACPTDPWTRKIAEVSKKRSKTDDDHMAIRRLEFCGSCYYDEPDGPFYLPGAMIESAIVEGARATKLGKSAQAGVICVQEQCELLFDGPQTPEERFEAGHELYCRVKLPGRGTTTMRSRPRFDEWAVAFELQIVASIVNPANVRQALDTAGLVKGIGDYRPRYGRFEVESFRV
jgi:hypothetical protein